MEKKLRWRVVGVEDKIERLITSLRSNHEIIPPENTRMIGNLNKWIEALVSIRNSIRNILTNLLPELERKFNSKLESPDMLLAVLFQPSVKNLFLELDTYYSDRTDSPISEAHLFDLMELHEAGKTLALVGDSALDLAVLPYVWESEVGKVGQLSSKRAEYVSNEHLADVCDRWGLFDYRIHFDPKTATKGDINHIKGTLVEAIFGILFLYNGLDAVSRTIPLLR